MKKIVVHIFILILCLPAWAQTGSLTISFTPSKPVQKAISIHVNKPLFKFDDSSGYWFINPHNSARHLQLSPAPNYGNADAAFITFNGNGDDLDLYQFGDDSDQAVFKTKGFDLRPPSYDRSNPDQNKPLHIHFTSFTASEVAFTISGNAGIESEEGNGADLGNGAVTGSGHFYREAKYAKTEALAGCDCDPTIYGVTYNKEEFTRTMSGCENAFSNKLFDAVQKALAPLYALSQSSDGQMKPGELTVNTLPGHTNTNVPAVDRPWCSSDYFHMRSTSEFSAQKIFNNDDAYGLRFIQMPDEQTLNGGGSQAALITKMTTLEQELKDGKLSTADYLKALTDLFTKAGTLSNNDVQKKERELNLYINIVFNPENREAASMNVDGKADVLHRVPGSVFELYSPLIKDGDGNWVADKYYIYLGKFSLPNAGKNLSNFNAMLTGPAYPQNAPRLAVYNIIIKMSGGKALIDKALAAMDIAALENLIIKQ